MKMAETKLLEALKSLLQDSLQTSYGSLWHQTLNFFILEDKCLIRMQRAVSPRLSETGWGFWGLTSLKDPGSNRAKLTAGTAGVWAKGSLVGLIETLDGGVDMNPGAWFSGRTWGSVSLWEINNEINFLHSNNFSKALISHRWSALIGWIFGIITASP